METSATPRPRLFRPEDVALQVTVGQLAVSGRQAVYTLRNTDERGERTDLWTVSLDGGAARPLTRSPGCDHTPRISPDGRALAFLRSAGDGPAQVHLLDLSPGGTGAEPRVLTAFARGAMDLDWEPSGSWLAVLAEDDTAPNVVVAGPDGEPPTSVVLRRIDWRADGEGEAGLRFYPRHLHRVPVDGAPSSRLTGGPWSAARPRVGGDGQVYFLADPRPDADLDPAAQVFRVPGAGASAGAGAAAGTGFGHGAIRQLTEFPGGVRRFHLTQEGVRVLAVDRSGARDDDPPELFDVELQSEPRLLAVGADHWLGRLGDETDLHEWQLELDDTAGVTTLSSGGSTMPVRADTGQLLLDGPGVCGAIADDGEQQVAVLALGTGARSPDLYALSDAGAHRLTEHGEWLAGYARPGWCRREVPGPGGPITVDVMTPPDGVATLGSVVVVHGGPTGQWGVVAPVEALVLASAGYQVVRPNIRGSIDRGRSWVGGLRGAWGDVDADDVLAVCDALTADGTADPARLGLMGLSYGGFLTQWLVGVTDRFAAAVAENGVSNQVAAWAGCDIGPAFCRAAGLGSAVTAEGVEQLWRSSPLRNVAQVRTPLLMLQAADDRTCPGSDNEQFFVALRALGREVEYVLYPQESHLMQATARLDRRIDRHRRVVEWFDRYLSGTAAQDPA